MYNIIKSVIERGEFSLPDTEHKIDKLWAEGKLSESQRDELVATARTMAKPDQNLDLYKTVMNLEKRVKALEEGGDIPDSDLPPEWRNGMIVYRGSLIMYEGKKYRCIAPEGFPCSWAPYGDNGYPPYWEVAEA